MNPRKNPIPAAIAIFCERGIELMIHSRTGSTLRITNSTPETNTAARAISQLTPMPLTTTKEKKALSPIPGASAMG